MLRIQEPVSGISRRRAKRVEKGQKHLSEGRAYGARGNNGPNLYCSRNHYIDTGYVDHRRGLIYYPTKH